jgi:hypothetical protein
MKLCGPPSVLVFPCPYPESLEKYTAMMKNTVFDYGAADPWRMPDDKKIAKNLPFQTCFNVTQRSLAVLYGFPINYKKIAYIRCPNNRKLSQLNRLGLLPLFLLYCFIIFRLKEPLSMWLMRQLGLQYRFSLCRRVILLEKNFKKRQNFQASIKRLSA